VTVAICAIVWAVTARGIGSLITLIRTYAASGAESNLSGAYHEGASKELAMAVAMAMTPREYVSDREKKAQQLRLRTLARFADGSGPALAAAQCSCLVGEFRLLYEVRSRRSPSASLEIHNRSRV
jgi:hypothetical protein